MRHFFKFLFSKSFAINLLILLLLIVSGLYGMLQYLDNYTLHGKKVEIPNLISFPVNQFDSLVIEDNHFILSVNDSLYVKGKKAGTILEQNPSPGTTVKQGRKIYVSVAALEPTKVSMPNLTDMSLRQATTLLQTYGLSLGNLEYIPDLCVNCILNQKMNGMELAKGTKVPVGSEIDLVVGRGLSDELVSVPYLIGMNVEFSKELLLSKSLNLGSLLYDETVNSKDDTLNAIIYRQIPAYQEQASTRMGSPVDLFLTVDSNRVNHSVISTDSL